MRRPDAGSGRVQGQETAGTEAVMEASPDRMRDAEFRQRGLPGFRLPGDEGPIWSNRKYSMKNENRLVIEKSYAIRPESNGMTVYDKKKHKFFFF